MSMASDLITEKSWKNVLIKTKFKDNGLQRALANYDRVSEEDPDACLKSIAAVNQCANNLKKSKDAASVPAVLDHITDLIEAIQDELKESAHKIWLAGLGGKEGGAARQKRFRTGGARSRGRRPRGPLARLLQKTEELEGYEVEFHRLRREAVPRAGHQQATDWSQAPDGSVGGQWRK